MGLFAQSSGVLPPVSDVGARKITTSEGIWSDASHPVQRAWIEVDVAGSGPTCVFRQV